jgi:inhibitor of KinA
MKPTFKQITPSLFELNWDKEVNDELLQKQLHFKELLLKDFRTKIIDIRLGFKTLSFQTSKQMDAAILTNWLRFVTEEHHLLPLSDKIWHLPVCYEKEMAADLISLTRAKNMSPEELIFLHSTARYRIHFYGFLPGFMYLNGLPEILHTPRKKSPSFYVPKGSVAIGGSQTGIYPSDSPGGWHLIGNCPSILFDAKDKNSVFAAAGDSVEFYPISTKEFQNLERHQSKPNSK